MKLKELDKFKKTVKIIRIILIAILAFIIFGIIGLILWKNYQLKEIDIITDNTKYGRGDYLRVRIDNKKEDVICLSTRIPYYFQIKSGVSWQEYNYKNLGDQDLIIKCIDPGKFKIFELVVPSVESGIHRLSIPACISCNLGKAFREDKRFFSNMFIIE